MICPNIDVGAGFREVRKHEVLALSTLEYRGTQVLEELTEPDFKFSCTSTGEQLHRALIICLSRVLQQFIQVLGKVLIFKF